MSHVTQEKDGAERDGDGRGRWVDRGRAMSCLPTRASTLCCYSLFSVNVWAFVDQDRYGAVVREVGQKQIQLDKDRKLQVKSPTELKTQQQEEQQDQSKSHQDVCVL